MSEQVVGMPVEEFRTAVDRFVANQQMWQKAERDLSASYVRIRMIVGAILPPPGTDLWPFCESVTQGVVDELAAETKRADDAEAEVVRLRAEMEQWGKEADAFEEAVNVEANNREGDLRDQYEALQSLRAAVQSDDPNRIAEAMADTCKDAMIHKAFVRARGESTFFDFAGAPALVKTLEARVQRLREALEEIGEFSECHHCDQYVSDFLHSLQVDIPAMVRAALARKDGEG